jgi:hypothetical protein
MLTVPATTGTSGTGVCAGGADLWVKANAPPPRIAIAATATMDDFNRMDLAPSV